MTVGHMALEPSENISLKVSAGGGSLRRSAEASEVQKEVRGGGSSAVSSGSVSSLQEDGLSPCPLEGSSSDVFVANKELSRRAAGNTEGSWLVNSVLCAQKISELKRILELEFGRIAKENKDAFSEFASAFREFIGEVFLPELEPPDPNLDEHLYSFFSDFFIKHISFNKVSKVCRLLGSIIEQAGNRTLMGVVNSALPLDVVDGK